jgi:hypothetical protein
MTALLLGYTLLVTFCFARALRGAEEARALLREVAGSGVEQDDPRLDYVTVQMDRATWDALRGRTR